MIRFECWRTRGKVSWVFFNCLHNHSFPTYIWCNIHNRPLPSTTVKTKNVSRQQLLTGAEIFPHCCNSPICEFPPRYLTITMIYYFLLFYQYRNVIKLFPCWNIVFRVTCFCVPGSRALMSDSRISYSYSFWSKSFAFAPTPVHCGKKCISNLFHCDLPLQSSLDVLQLAWQGWVYSKEV